MELGNARQILSEARFVLEHLTGNPARDKELELEKAAAAAYFPLALIRTLLADEQQFEDADKFNASKAILLNHFDAFQGRLTGEIRDLHIYVLEEKRGYSVTVLLRDVEQVLPPDDRGLISDLARSNMQEAGACLAFERNTACGYHIARAVEDVARQYSRAVTGHPSPYHDRNGEVRHRSLPQIAGELQDALDSWEDPTNPLRLLTLIVPTLRNFCRIYRNPLSHADPDLKELSPNEAEIAFGHAISAISTMLEDGRAGGPHFQQPCVWR
jgi:hypothetical protein